MTDQLTVLGIAASLRKRSYNGYLLAALAGHAPAGLGVSVYDDLQPIPVFNEDLEEHGGPEAVLRLRAAVAAAHGLIIVTPEYNQSIPGVTKNLVDWMSRGEPRILARKPVAIAGATPGPWGTRLAQAALRHTLTACGSLVMPLPQVYVRSAADTFDDQGRLQDARTDQQLRGFMQAFAAWVRQWTPGAAAAG
jgi:chromate reductase, NAD(P)H dehydrogenase (quinone)